MSENLLSNQINSINASSKESYNRLEFPMVKNPVGNNTLAATELARTAKHYTFNPTNDTFIPKTAKHNLIKKQYYKTYNHIWKKMGLPKELMPKIIFRDFSATKIFFGYSFPKGHIAIPESIEKLDYIKKIGKDKFLLAHECGHAKQIFDIVRLYGSEKLKQILLNSVQNDSEFDYIIDNFNQKYYDKVRKTMGRLDQNSPEGKKAAQFAEALAKYKSPRKIISKYEKAPFWGKLILFAKYKKTMWSYKHNLLETDANNSAKRVCCLTFPNKINALKENAIKVYNIVSESVKKSQTIKHLRLR